MSAIPILTPGSLNTAGPALLRILRRLADAGYEFVTPNRSTAALVAGRLPRATPGALRDVFGWNRPFGCGDIPPAFLDDLAAMGALSPRGNLFRSTLRVATIDGRLVGHSAPGRNPGAVFLGPDSYRFVRFLHEELNRRPDFASALDIGVGAGAGALTLSGHQPGALVIGTDVNPRALEYLEANATHAGLNVEPKLTDGVPDGAFDLIVTNPPFIAGKSNQTYRDGGDEIGTQLSLLWARKAIAKLTSRGRFVLYTGSPIVDGADPVRAALADLADTANLDLRYTEIDPDIFGGMLRGDAYASVERIAAVGAVLTKTS